MSLLLNALILQHDLVLDSMYLAYPTCRRASDHIEQ